MQNEIDIVRDISRRFEAAGIAYMLTGAMAMNYYAQPRMTRDIDVVVELSPGDAGKVVRAFTPDYYASPQVIAECLSRRSMFNLVHQASIIKIDCIVRKPSEYRKTEFARRKQVQVEDFPTWIVSKEDLILSKLDWAKDSHSEFQLRDVKNLLQTGCDREYLDSWTSKLGVDKLLEECLHG